jgi:hypothetical protein
MTPPNSSKTKRSSKTKGKTLPVLTKNGTKKTLTVMLQNLQRSVMSAILEIAVLSMAKITGHKKSLSGWVNRVD